MFDVQRIEPNSFPHKASSGASAAKPPRPGVNDKLTLTTTTPKKGTNLILQGDPSPNFLVVRCGWVCLYTILDDGRRSNIGFALPGDIVGLSMNPLEERSFSATTLTDASLYVGRNSQVAKAANHSLGLSNLLYEHFYAQNAEARDQLVLLTSRTAEERVAHLLASLAQRLLKRPLTDGTTVNLPLTQQEIGDALSLTSVHVNRMLRALRDRGTLQLQRGVLTILNANATAEVAHLDCCRRWDSRHSLAQDICACA